MTNSKKFQELAFKSREWIEYIKDWDGNDFYKEEDIENACKEALQANYKLTDFLMSLLSDSVLELKANKTK